MLKQKPAQKKLRLRRTVPVNYRTTAPQKELSYDEKVNQELAKMSKKLDGANVNIEQLQASIESENIEMPTFSSSEEKYAWLMENID